MLSVDLSRGWAEILRGCEVLMKLGKCVFPFKENHGINYKITHISAESKEIYIESSTGKKVDILTFEDFEKVVQVLQEQGSFVYGSTPPRGLPTRSKLAVIEFCHPQMMYMSEDDCVVIISPSDAKRWFSAERVRNAVQHLNEFGTLNFLDVAIVLAVNGVNQVNFINPNEKNEGGYRFPGTDRFLDKFSLAKGFGMDTLGSYIRPYAGLKLNHGLLSISKYKTLWGHAMSSRGHREWEGRGALEKQQTSLRLTSLTRSFLNENIPEEFRFEEFLVWFFASSGIPSNIYYWGQLFDLFLREHGLSSIGDDFSDRFYIRNPLEVIS